MGKWEIKEFDAVRVDLGQDNSCLLFGADSEANAQKIAAAPELLDACKEIITHEHELFDEILEGDLGSTKTRWLIATLEKIKRVVANVEGEKAESEE